MNLYAVAAACVGTFAVLHFLVVPRAEAITRSSIDSSSVTKAASYAVVDMLRSVALLASLSAVVTLIALWIVQSRGGTSLTDFSATLSLLREWRDLLLEVNPVLGIVAIVCLVIGLSFLSHRRGKMRMNDARNKAVQAEINRVLEDGREGKWQELPPTELMKQLMERRNTFVAEAQEISAQLESPPQDGKILGQYTPAEARARLEAIAEALKPVDHHMLLEEVGRRMDVRFRPDEVMPPPPRTRWEKFQAFFISRGLMSSFHGVSRIAFVLGFLLLFPSLLAVAAPTVGGAVSQRINSVEQLYIEASAKELEQSWKQATASEVPNPSAQVSAEDNALLDELARQYEVGTARQLVVVLRLPADGGAASLARSAVREDILEEAARRAPGQSEVTRGEIAETTRGARTQRIEHELASLQRATLESKGPVTPGGQQFRQQLERDLVHGAPKTWQELKTKAKAAVASFHEPLKPAELRALLISRVVNVGAAGTVPEIAELVERIDPKTFERTNALQSRRAMVELVQRHDLGDSLKKFGELPHEPVLFTESQMAELRTVAQRVPTVESSAAHYREASPAYHSVVAERGANIERATVLSREMGERVYPGRRPPSGFGDALATFDDHFPGQAAAARSSPHAKVVTELKMATAAEVRTAAANSATMARSFTKLTGFRRIGGVLIGRAPDGNDTLDFSQIEWRKDGNKVILKLTRGDGQQLTIGPYRPELVHLALAYAADARPITVTMTPSAPLRELKIHLHPTLVDTAGGCRATEIDRFVDRFSDGDEKTSPREIASKRVYGHVALYRWVWAVNLKAKIEAASLLSRDGGGEELANARLLGASKLGQDLLGMASRTLESDEVRALAVDGLAEVGTLNDGAQSPLTIKREYFAGSVLKKISQCTSGASAPNPSSSPGSRVRPDLDAVTKCVEGAAAGELTQSKPIDSTMSWTAPPPSIEIWSGVRERPYRLDADLDFVRSSGPANANWSGPLDFTVQVAFASPPYLMDSARPWYEIAEEKIEAQADETPWQFPALQPWVRNKVKAGIAAHKDAAETFEAMTEFTYLQRLFRIALDGKLGDRFPLVRLTALARESRDWVKPGVQTARWNARPGALESGMVQISREVLQEKETPQLMAVRKAAQSCIEAVAPRLASPPGRVELSRMSAPDWANVCGFGVSQGDGADPSGDSSDPLVQDVRRLALEVMYARSIRAALGVSRDDELMVQSLQNGSACAPF